MRSSELQYLKKSKHQSSWAEQARAEAKKLSQRPCLLGHCMAGGEAPTLADYMEGVPSGFDIRSDDPAIENSYVINFAKPNELDDGIAEEEYMFHAPITENMAGPWTVHIYDEDGEWVRTLGYEGVIDNQYAVNDSLLRQEIERDIHIIEQKRIAKNERTDARIFDDNNKRIRGSEETREHRRNKEERDSRFDKIIAWIQQASKTQIQKHIPSFWTRLKESQTDCKRAGSFTNVFVTKAQANNISMVVKSRLKLLKG